MQNRQKKEKKILRSVYSGRILNGKPVILEEEALEYVKKQGFHVIAPQLIACTYVLFFAFIIIGLFLMIPSVSATSSLTMDMTSNISLLIIAIIFLIGIGAYWIGHHILSGATFLILGFLLLANEINAIISALIIIVGVIIIFKEGRYH